MTQFIRNLIEFGYKIIKTNKTLSRFKPVLDATDAFFFGTDKVTVFAPHIVDSIDIKRFMTTVIVGLLPATLAAVYIYGIRAVQIILVSYIAGGVVEVLFAAVRKREIEEGFLITGLIFPLTLPPTVPLWVVAVGVIFGTIFGKEIFGGTGRNVFNPALIGRIFITISFPSILGLYQVPFTDTVTTATPLINYKSTLILSSFKDLLFGNTAGCIGETFRIGLIIGGLFLMYTKVSNWRIPVSYLGSVLIFAFLGNSVFGQKFAPPLFQLLSGGLLLGAFFMATDPVTCPFTPAGKWVAGILLGFLTVLIRGLSGYAEGVMFAIILMNVFTPLIDTVVLEIKYRPQKK